MYQVIIKGNNLAELKKAAEDLHLELNEGVLEKGPKVKIEKNLSIIKDEEKFSDDIPVVDIPMSDPRANDNFTSPVVDIPSNGNIIGEVDSEGVPWNKDIHASSKNKIGNGTWRVKRGVDDSTVEKYKSQFRGGAIQSMEKSTSDVRSNDVKHTPIDVSTQAAAIAQHSVAVSHGTPALPSINSRHTSETFVANFPLVFSQLISQGKITQDYVNQLKNYFKVDQIWQITDSQKIDVFNTLVECGIIQKVG